MTNKMPSQVQDSEVGDETTSVTVLASEFIRETEKLVEMIIHPQVSLLLLLLHLLLLVFLPCLPLPYRPSSVDGDKPARSLSRHWILRHVTMKKMLPSLGRIS